MLSHHEKSLLIVHQGALGDFILTFPALLKLKRNYRRIDAICQNKLGKLAEYLNIIDKSFPLEAAACASLYLDTIDARLQNRLSAYHTIILFSFSMQLEHSVRNSTSSQVYRIPPRPAPEQNIHVAEHIFSRLTAIGEISQEAKKNHNVYSITKCADYCHSRAGGNPEKHWIPVEDPVFSRDHVRYDGFDTYNRRKPDREASKIFIHPGSGSPLKNWPLPNFMKLYKALESKGFHPAFILGPAEEPLIDRLKGSQWTVHMVSDLVKLAALLKTAGGYIGNDSGVTHLAAFLGGPTVTIFGPSNPVRWQPAGNTVRVVTSDTDCDPCFETHRDTCNTKDCLKNISIQQVMDSFLKIFLPLNQS